jgi:hypothetical protein
MAIADLVKQLSETMLTSLPHFWKIATDFTTGKLKKVCGHVPRYQHQY